MFDIGWGELLLVGIIALIAIGPKELPTVMRTVGHWMGKVRRMASEFQGQFQEALREAEMEDLKKQADEFKTAITDATQFDPLADIDNDGDSGLDTAASEAEQPATETAEATKAEAKKSDAEHADEAEKIEPPAQAEAAEHAAEPVPLPAVDVPPQEKPEPVAEQDLVPAEMPPPKQAGGKA